MELGVAAQMNATVSRLDQTVAMAEDQIHQEVTLVQSDVAKYVDQTQDQFSTENDFMKFQLAGTFTLLAGLISMWHMTGHLRAFNNPSVQRKILAILWMSPIYGVTSWLSLVLPQFEGYLGIVKDFYESYVIYQFLSFLISVLGRGDRDTVVDLLADHTDHLEPPVRCCGWFRGKYPYGDSRTLANDILLQCQVFTMQFVFFKPVTAIGLFVFNTMEYYGGGTGPTDYRAPQFWLNIVQNVSVFTAFSGLLKFYHAVQDDLAWCKPFPKFMTIKGIVFMTFWQGLVISFLANATVATTSGTKEDPDAWGKQAQNFLICLEMLLFSIAHFYCFPTEEWEEGYRPSQEKKTKFGDNMALGDFMSDLKLIMRGNKSGGKGKKNEAEVSGDTDDSADDEVEDNYGSVAVENDDGNSNSISDESINSEKIRLNIAKSLDAPDDDVRDAAQRLLLTVNENTGDSIMEVSYDKEESEADEADEADEASQPDEETSLLGNSNDGNDKILRASIFTSM